LRTLQANSSQGSTFDVHQVYPATKLHAWKEAARGKSKGRIYGTTDMASNFRQGFFFLTQPSSSGSRASHSDQLVENQQLRA